LLDVLAAVQLDNETSFETDKIHNEARDGVLPSKHAACEISRLQVGP
jgi:hypothetical protein